MLRGNCRPFRECITLNACFKFRKNNNFEYGISMEFDTKEAYEAYNQHPDHTDFVKTFWMRDVADFLEIDFEPLS